MPISFKLLTIHTGGEIGTMIQSVGHSLCFSVNPPINQYSPSLIGG
jgi:hypothetical protein